MARKDKRTDYRRPDGTARVSPARPPAAPHAPVAAERPRSAWVPLAAALTFMLLLILLVVVLNRGSAPFPTTQ